MHSNSGLVAESAGHFHARNRDDDDSCLLQAMRLLTDHCETSPPITRREQRARDAAAMKQAQAAWECLLSERREALVLQVLRDDRLIIREICDRVNRELGASNGARAPRPVYATSVDAVVKRMVRGGHLEREAETFNKTHTRYRYFRTRTLDGPIVQLERSYRDEAEETA